MKKIIENFLKSGRFFNLVDGSKKAIAPKNSITDDRSEATIYMYDEISSWWGINAMDFAATLNELIDVPIIHLRINCPGGEIFEAAAMQKIMAEHPAKFIAHIDCLAASAMSFMIRGADERIISDMGFIMIHRAMSGIYGNGDELISWGEALKKMDSTISGSYMKVTGEKSDVVDAWMEKETWFTAEEALEYGFVDEISEAEPVENVFDMSGYENLPEALMVVIDKKSDDIPIEKIINIENVENEQNIKANARKRKLALLGL